MGTYPPYQAPLRPQGRHGMRNRFAEGSGRIATEMAPWACIRLSERSRFPGGLARIAAEIAQQVSIRFAKHSHGEKHDSGKEFAGRTRDVQLFF